MPEDDYQLSENLLKVRAAALTGSLQRLAATVGELGTDLLGGADFLENLPEECAVVLRPFQVARALDAGYLVAVAGLQGDGKTTLVRALYDLKGWIVANEGQGEQMPVFVVEDAIPAPQGRLVTASAEVSAEMPEFQRAIRGENPLVLYPELRTPTRHFPGHEPGQAGFLLLPGYEAINGLASVSDQFWQAMMREALSGAAAILLLVRPKTMASADAQEIITSLRSQHLGDSNPLVVVNLDSDPASDPAAERENRDAAADAFGCEPDDVLFVWRRGLTLDVSQVAQQMAESPPERAKPARTRWVELGRHVRDVDQLVARVQGLQVAFNMSAKNDATLHLADNLLAPFNTGVADLRTRFAARLDDVEDMVLDAALARADDLLKTQEAFDRLYGQLIDHFGTRPATVAAARRELVRQCWHGADDAQPSRIALQMPELLDGLTNSRLTAAGCPRLLDGLGSRLPAVSSDDPAGVDRNTAAAIRQLLTGVEDGRGETRDRLQPAAALVSVVALQWSAYTARVPEVAGLNRSTMAPESSDSPESVLQDFVAKLGTLTQLQEQVVESMASIAGLGTAENPVKSVGGLLGALRSGKTVQAVSVSAVRIAGGLAAAAGIFAVYDVARRARYYNREVVKAALRAISDRDRELRLAAFDELMDHTRDLLVARAREVYDLDAAYGQVDRLNRALGRVSRDRRRFLEALGEVGISLE